MRIHQRLELGPKLRQRLKPIPIQLLEQELLQVPVVELAARIQSEVERNPCLELASPVSAPLAEEERRREREAEQLAEFAGDARLPVGVEPEEEAEQVPSFTAPPVSFWRRLEIQLNLNFPENSPEHRIARAILDHLNPEGFLETPVEELARKLGVPAEQVERVRQLMFREWDPLGIAARDPRELYLLQLETLGYQDHPAYRLIRDHWPLLRMGGLPAVQPVLGLSDEEAEEIQHLFDTLYPSPRAKYGDTGTEAAYVVPEVFFRVVEGQIVVELEESLVPRVRLSRYYERLLKNPDTDPKTRKFLQERIQRALEFLRALDSRRQNIRRVAELIAATQKNFLLGQRPFLVPMTETEAAEQLGTSVSTISRIVRDRYADTPVGVFELRFFFRRGAGGSHAVGIDEVQERLRQLVAQEDPEHPLTDEALARILREEFGIKISRRSITEYRKALGIPRSSRRRRKRSKSP